MKKKDLSVIRDLFKGSTKKEKEALIEEIMKMLNATPDATNSCDEMVRENIGTRPDCPHCHAEAKSGLIVKRGLNKGAQRFKCKKCNKYFLSTTNTMDKINPINAPVFQPSTCNNAGKQNGTNIIKNCCNKTLISYSKQYQNVHALLTPTNQ